MMGGRDGAGQTHIDTQDQVAGPTSLLFLAPALFPLERPRTPVIDASDLRVPDGWPEPIVTNVT